MVTVLDLAKLEGQSCEYYAVVKKEYGALLPPPNGDLWAHRHRLFVVEAPLIDEPWCRRRPPPSVAERISSRGYL